MMVEKHLEVFYAKNGIPPNGGVDKDTFEFAVFGLKLQVPNPQFRKDALHIHDIQHLVNDCDTSWKGEGFISGWEIATGMWKHFPLSFLALWAMGYALWLYPKAVLDGFRKGLNDVGIIDLKFSKEVFLQMEFDELVEMSKKDGHTDMRLWQWVCFLFWCLTAQVILLSPLITVLALALLVWR
jgi:hypothetical protein